MAWFRRVRSTAPPGNTPPEREEPEPSAYERSAPGLAALFSGLEEDGSRSLLDLGPGAESNFLHYGRFARRIRFADVLGAPSRGESWAAALAALPDSDEPYDLVLAWDLLDRLPPEERPRFTARIDALTAPGARIYVVVESSGEPTTQPLRFTLLGLDQLRQEATGEARPAWPQLLPAEVKRLLRPFEVVQAFTLRLGYREYVAAKKLGVPR